jgi:hypothetical protein
MRGPGQVCHFFSEKEDWSMVATDTLSVTVEDFTGQIRRRARGIPRDATVGDLVSSLTHELRLPANDSQGRPLTYSARVRGESLSESDRVGDVLMEDEVVTLSQNVTAG